jgi:hypothetical protein
MPYLAKPLKVAILTVIFLTSLASSLLGSQQPSFISHRDYVAAINPQTITKADLNGDGIVDLIVVDGDVNFTLISILFGNRDGSFQPPKFVDVGGRFPFQAVVGDFNGDGKDDLAITTIDGLSVMLGDGHGDFGAPHLFTAFGFFLEGIVAADFNGDHKLDLAVANNNTNTVSILLGAGDGTFTLAATMAVGMAPSGIALGDFNHDGHFDLAVANSGIPDGFNNQGPHANTVSILLGEGNGHFHPAVFIPVAAGPLGLAIDDFDNDSEQDIVVTNSRADLVTLMLGNGDGTFATPRTFTVTRDGKSPVQGYIPSGIAVDDFNGDGNKDLAVTNVGTNTVAVLLGDGKGSFGKALNLPVGRAENAGMGVATGDFNRDGKVDLVTGNSGADTISVILGKGNGTFVEEPAFPVGERPFQLVVADFNNDGIPDVATANVGNDFKGNTVSVLLGKKGGGFQSQKVITIAQNMAGLAAADFNGDGKVDLVVVSTALNEGFVLLGRGDGTFAPPVAIPVGAFPGYIAIGDFNGDGKQDIAVSNFNGPISILLGDGKGGFRKGADVSIPDAVDLFSIVTSDFNRDGKTDLAILTRTIGDFFVVKTLLGNGDGTFQSDHDVTAALPSILSFAVGDLNNDGIPDIAVEEGGVIETMLGDGFGHFTSAGKFPEGELSRFSAVQALAVGDFNGDGFLDVAGADGFSDNLVILTGKGDGTLTALPHFFAAEGGTNAIGVADFNGDHRLDIVLASTDSQNNKGQVVLLINSTPK